MSDIDIGPGLMYTMRFMSYYKGVAKLKNAKNGVVYDESQGLF